MAVNYGNYGIFLVMGNAGYVSSTVRLQGPSISTLRDSKAQDGQEISMA